MHLPSILLAGLLAAAGASQAQQVWRCGNSYGSEPCPGGTPVSVAPAVSGADPRATKAAARLDAGQAAALEKARLAQEKAAAPAIVIAPAQAAAPDKNPKKGDGKKPQGRSGSKEKTDQPFTAVGVTPKPARK